MNRDRVFDASEIPTLEGLLGKDAREVVANGDKTRETILQLSGSQWDRLLSNPALRDLNALSQELKGCKCFRIIPNQIAKAGYGSGVDIRSDEALVYFRKGYTVWINDLKGLPFFRVLEERWADDFDLPRNKLYLQLFISPPGVGTLRHFDMFRVTVFQLKGTKRWEVAPFDHERDGYPEKESELFPDSAPLQGQRTLDLESSSFLCLPHFWWHTTKAITESWSLSAFVDFSSESDL